MNHREKSVAAAGLPRVSCDTNRIAWPGAPSRILRLLSVSLLLLALSASASASVIFSQPHDGSATLHQSSRWDPDGSDWDQLIWDRFSLATSEAVTAVNWRGGGGVASIVGFDVAIYASLAGGSQPDLGYLYPGPLVSYNVNGTAGQTYVGTFGGVAMYDYHYTLPSPFQASAGAYYWIYIVARQSVLPTWGFANGGTGTHFRSIALGGDNYYQTVTGDVAFSLEKSDAPTVNIAASANPVSWGTVQGAGSYPVGSTASLTAVPAAGYGFVNWTENGNVVSNNPTYNFTATVNRTLVANFTVAYAVTTSSQPQAGGTTSGDGTYNEGQSVTVDAVASSGYVFSMWLDGGNPVSNSSSYTFQVTHTSYLTAVFEQLATTALFDFDTGFPAVAPGQTMPATQLSSGLTASFTPLGLGAWSIQNSFLYGWVPNNFSGNFLYPSSPYGSLQISFDVPLSSLGIQFVTAENMADFDIASLVRITGYSGSTSNPPVGSASDRGAWITGAYPEGGVTFASATPFDIVVIDIPPGQGYPISNLLWIDNIIAQRVAPQNINISAVVSPPEGGVVTGTGSYEFGSRVTLTASPNPGYSFAGWTEGDITVSTDALYEFFANVDRNLIANFAQGVTLTTMVEPAGAGTAFGDGSYPLDTWASIWAEPNAGYVFKEWDQNGAPYSTWQSDAVYMDSNRVLTALFAQAVSIQLAVGSGTGSVFGDGEYAIGQPVELRAVPVTGMAFVKWMEGGVTQSTSPNYPFVAAVSRTLSAVFAPDTLSATFDFDTGLPLLNSNDQTPFSQSSEGWQAEFLASSGLFSVQSEASLGWPLSRVSGHFLFPVAGPSGFDVVFDRPVDNVWLSFATFDFQLLITPSVVQLTAWSDTAGTTLAGQTTAVGTIKVTDIIPTGTLGLTANGIQRIRVEMPAQPSGVTDFVIDNITVRETPNLVISYDSSTNPNDVILHWIAPTAGYALEKSIDPLGMNWSLVLDPVVIVGAEYQVVVPMSEDQATFRLSLP
ncbi:MAG: hypothetical protein KDB65_08165 [Calditrichaeota bacterium]|nr:hypothetical protein [Calditrichota bacterium]MCB9369885.1 hypothetical protein [Calditrichota bacterium]